MKNMDIKVKRSVALISLFIVSTAFANEPQSKTKQVEVANTPDVYIRNESLPVAVNPADQIVCAGDTFDVFYRDEPFTRCQQASKPGETFSFTLNDLYMDGWFIQGIYRANGDYVVFNK